MRDYKARYMIKECRDYIYDLAVADTVLKVRKINQNTSKPEEVKTNFYKGLSIGQQKISGKGYKAPGLFVFNWGKTGNERKFGTSERIIKPGMFIDIVVSNRDLFKAKEESEEFIEEVEQFIFNNQRRGPLSILPGNIYELGEFSQDNQIFEYAQRIEIITKFY